MKLKDAHSGHWLIAAIGEGWKKRPQRFWGIALYSILIFALGAIIFRPGLFGEIKPFIKERIKLMPRIMGGLMANPEQITIDIRHKNFMKLNNKRQEALEKGILFSSTGDYVPAKIRYKDKTIDVRMRLKGDLTDHLETEKKWSFRIKVRGDNTFMGMKQFSLQHPGTRGYIYEWLYHQALKREGLISLRYDFVNVTLNGKDWGIYALEEHFEKRLIENNEMREGPIVRFNENLCWEEEFQQGFPKNWEKLKNGSGSYLSSDIDTFQTRRLLSDPAMYSQFAKAVHLLESFRRGILKTSEVFDVQKLAKNFAISDLMGASHSTLWINVRFYYNPITSRLEPIGFDARGDEPLKIKSLLSFKPSIDRPEKDDVYYYYLYFLDMIFSDITFFEEYIKQLERISQKLYLDKYFEELTEELELKLNIIYSEFPSFEFSKDVIYQNQHYIRTVLNPVKGLHTYFSRSSKDSIELKLGNIQYLPIEVVGVSYKDSTVFAQKEKILLSGKYIAQPVNYRRVHFFFPNNFEWSNTMLSDVKVNYRVIGTSDVRFVEVFPWEYMDDDFVTLDFIRKNANVAEFDFLVIDESAKKIFIRRGDWNLNRSLIIPKGYEIISGERTRLNLSDSAIILSYSPLNFKGSNDYPIVIESTDSTGQGVVVMNADQTSVLEHVIFKNLSNPSQSGWELTGAVTFYESPVFLTDCQFIGNRSEDALNIVRSEFEIHQTLFSKTHSDAFDGDFVKGKIIKSSFVDSGNDAVDVSGSVIDIQNVFINGAGDKGLSTGEKSRVNVNDIAIRNAEIAVASKDISDIIMKDVTISGSKIGLTAYQKKSEFGPATIRVEKIGMKETEIPYLVEEQSTIIVDGAKIASSRKNVKDILYGVEYGKSSK